MNELTHFDIFSGIGGFALAAQWAGFRTIGFCEVDAFPSAVLRKHWPDVPNYGDVKCAPPPDRASRCSPAAIPASATATLLDMGQARRVRRFMACRSLIAIGRVLFCAKTHPSFDGMLPGLGGDSEAHSKAWATRFSLSARERVALALTIDGNACSCSPNFRTPTARDYKGMSAKSWRERSKGDVTPTLPDQLGGTPHPDFLEALMGYPIGWTALNPSATPSTRAPSIPSSPRSPKSPR